MVITHPASPVFAELPEAMSPVLADDVVNSFRLIGSRAELGELEIVHVKGQSFDVAARVTTLSDPGTEWNLQLVAPTNAAIRKGDVLLAKFWLRCVNSMTGDGFTGFVLDQIAPPHGKVVEFRVGAGKEWLECFVPFKAMQDYPSGSTRICFRAGFDRQTIELGGIEITNYGRAVDIATLPRTNVTYAGRDANAAWRKAALEQIETIRKGDLTVQVVDASNKPIANANVHVKLKLHAFGFGSCVTVEQIFGTGPDDAKCREIIETYFNRVVFENDMKWPAMWDGAPPTLDKAVDWLLERKIQVRGHNLQWPSWNWSPRQLRQYENDPGALRQICADRVSSAVAHFKGKLLHWDVVNEPYNNVDLLNILGKDVMIDWFKLAKQADPDCKMFLNDFGIFDGGPGSEHREHFYDTIRWLKDSGAPIDGVGIQSHFGAMVPPPTQLTAILDQFSEFGLPIESTEFSLNTDNRELQSDYLRDYMIAVFAHPNVNGITLWGFWESRHWRPQAALWTHDWQLRPHGKVWIDLITRQWNTDVTLATNANGEANVRGFLGDYVVTVTTPTGNQSAAVTLKRDGSQLTVTICP